MSVNTSGSNRILTFIKTLYRRCKTIKLRLKLVTVPVFAQRRQIVRSASSLLFYIWPRASFAAISASPWEGTFLIPQSSYYKHNINYQFALAAKSSGARLPLFRRGIFNWDYCSIFIQMNVTITTAAPLKVCIIITSHSRYCLLKY